jgi:hypothetical protein
MDPELLNRTRQVRLAGHLMWSYCVGWRSGLAARR